MKPMEITKGDSVKFLNGGPKQMPREGKLPRKAAEFLTFPSKNRFVSVGRHNMSCKQLQCTLYIAVPSRYTLCYFGFLPVGGFCLIFFNNPSFVRRNNLS